MICCLADIFRSRALIETKGNEVKCVFIVELHPVEFCVHNLSLHHLHYSIITTTTIFYHHTSTNRIINISDIKFSLFLSFTLINKIKNVYFCFFI